LTIKARCASVRDSARTEGRSDAAAANRTIAAAAISVAVSHPGSLAALPFR
jgi:hypothetical protein